MTAQEFKAWRLARKWNQAKAADYLGTTQASVSRWEAGNDKKARKIPREVVILAYLLTFEQNIRRVESFFFHAP